MYYENALLEPWEPRRFSSWVEAWKAFQKTDLIELRGSILRYGFGYDAGGDGRGYFERLHNYLEVAEGYTNFQRTDSQGKRKTIKDITERVYCYRNDKWSRNRALEGVKGFISRIAFEVLCQEVFKNTEEKRDLPSWCYYVTDEKTLKKILCFFRLKGSYIQNLDLHRLNQDNHMRIAHDFLRNLVFRAWPVRSEERSDSEFPSCFEEDSLGMFQKYQPDFVEILCGLGETDRILTRKLSPRGRQRLRSIVMNKEIGYGSRRRKVKSVEEAALHGFSPARTLFLYTQLEIARHREENARKVQQRKEEVEAEIRNREREIAKIQACMEAARERMAELGTATP
ncbi:MAG: hypothetical protein V1690_01315 [Candidatus Moraniibacteriota bacterium]